MSCRMANGIVMVVASYNLFKPMMTFVLFGYHFQIYFYALHGGLSLVLLIGATEDPTGTCMHSCLWYCYSSCVQGLTDESYQSGEGGKFTWSLSQFNIWKCWCCDCSCTLTPRIGGIFGSFTFSFKSDYCITEEHLCSTVGLPEVYTIRFTQKRKGTDLVVWFGTEKE